MNELTKGTSEINVSDIHKAQPENKSAMREARDYLREATNSGSTDIFSKETDKGNVERSMDSSAEKWGGKYVDAKTRMDITPVNDGRWEGEPGTSKFIPEGNTQASLDAKNKLAEYGLDGIEYKNLEPDFSECSEGTVEIADMTEQRYGDTHHFPQADQKLADQWNKECRNGKNDYTASDVKQYREDNKLTWHERCDTKTMDLVPREIHDFFRHSGGVAECQARDKREAKFDE